MARMVKRRERDPRAWEEGNQVGLRGALLPLVAETQRGAWLKCVDKERASSCLKLLLGPRASCQGKKFEVKQRR